MCPFPCAHGDPIETGWEGRSWDTVGGSLQLQGVFARCKYAGQGQCCPSPAPSKQLATQAVGKALPILMACGRRAPGVRSACQEDRLARSPESNFLTVNLPSPLGTELLPKIRFCLFPLDLDLERNLRSLLFWRRMMAFMLGRPLPPCLEGGQPDDTQPQNPAGPGGKLIAL